MHAVEVLSNNTAQITCKPSINTAQITYKPSMTQTKICLHVFTSKSGQPRSTAHFKNGKRFHFA